MDIPSLINRTKSAYKKNDPTWRVAEIAEYQKEIKLEIDESLRVSAYRLEAICTHYSILSFHLIENNDFSGNSRLYLNLAYMYFEASLEQKYLFDKQKKSMEFEEIRCSLFKLAPMLLWAMIFGNKNLAIKIKKQMDFYLDFKNVKDVLSLEYEFFCLWIFAKWSEIDIETEKYLKNDFLELICIWEQHTNLLEPTLLKICDFHCVEIADNMRKKMLPRFTRPPFDLVPLEIHAFNLLRCKFGLSKIEIDHPLMNTQIAKSQQFEIIEDEFLEFVQINMF